jgi:hypothetical protein
VKNLMYGFGDDRNPASDTVNVMEEILIEYITDVVRYLFFCSFSYSNDISVSDRHRSLQKDAAIDRRPASRSVAASRRQEARKNGGTFVHAGGY